MNFLYNTFLNLGLSEKTSDVTSFFLYEIAYLSVILMIGLIFFTYMRVRFLGEDFADKLNKKPKIVVYLGMALLGIVSPFCSCSTIPVFISFAALGIPTGALFVFLITSPMVQEASLLLLLSNFGVPVALLYVGLGVLTGVIAGLLISRAKDSELFNAGTLNKRTGTTSCCSDTVSTSCCGGDDAQPTSCCGDAASTSCCGDDTQSTSCCGDSDASCGSSKANISSDTPFKYAVHNALDTYKSMFKFILLGIAIGAFVHGFVPESMIQSLLGSDKTFAPIFATIVGIPTYADDVALIPVAKTLVDGGAGLGTALSFVMAASVVSIPSFIMLGSTLKKKTLVKLVVLLTIAIICIGYVFNYVAPYVI